MAPKTMFDKIWDTHVVRDEVGEDPLLYVDLHLVHEVTSPQAFEGLRETGRTIRRPDLTIAVADHNVPTEGDRSSAVAIADPVSAAQLAALGQNAAEFGIGEYYDIYSPNQGIVHIIGPEQGWTQPGMLIVCGDSHTATHGAVGAIAMPVGTSQVEHTLATQCLTQTKLPTMEIRVNGELGPGVSAKDVILGVIGEIGVGGMRGYAVEYTGEVIRALTMDGRFTVCNMTVEGGGRVGMIAPDQTTYDYLRSRPHSPQGEAWDLAVERWSQLPTDAGASYDLVVEIDGSKLAPMVTWGTNPGMTASVKGKVGDPAEAETPAERAALERALAYMGLEPNTPIESINIDRAFIGSCTNSRIEDLRAAAAVVAGKHVAPTVNAMVVPGSWVTKKQAEAEGLDRVFLDAGFEWREAGCSMCLAMNPDKLEPGERCASTSNRNFEGRQGSGGRTHLVSPAMAAAAAVAGHFVDVREWK